MEMMRLEIDRLQAMVSKAGHAVGAMSQHSHDILNGRVPGAVGILGGSGRFRPVSETRMRSYVAHWSQEQDAKRDLLHNEINGEISRIWAVLGDALTP
jgi:hypothetical protein